MSSLYIHIPFCKQKCHYCDFYKEDYRLDPDSYFDAIEREMEFRKEYFRNEPIETIYFGGGTPSVYHPSYLQRIINSARKYREFDKEIEITVEINPEDATDEYLAALAETKVNRISFGIQSFIDRDLRLLNRRHDSKRAMTAIMKARELGFDNICGDLIFGIPDMSLLEWEKSILKVIALGIDHVSTYMLTVEPDTHLGRMLESGELIMPDDAECEAQFLLAHRLLTDAGFKHYELSNYTRDPFFRSRHNSNYWCGNGYLGLGAGAFSYNGKVRSSGVADVDKYIRHAGTDAIYENEELSHNDKYNEYVMVSLRTCAGVQRDILTRRFGTDALLYFEHQAGKFLSHGLMVREGNEYKIPPEKFMLSDAIIRELFWKETE